MSISVYFKISIPMYLPAIPVSSSRVYSVGDVDQLIVDVCVNSISVRFVFTG